MSLEAFQSGLSWLTILRKRENFRAAFADFEPEAVARFGDDDVERLIADAGIVRNRAKIEATIANARATVALHEDGGTLRELIWERYRPAPRDAPPRDFADVPAADARDAPRWPRSSSAAASASSARRRSTRSCRRPAWWTTTAVGQPGRDLDGHALVDDHPPAACPASSARRHVAARRARPADQPPPPRADHSSATISRSLAPPVTVDRNHRPGTVRQRAAGAERLVPVSGSAGASGACAPVGGPQSATGAEGGPTQASPG